MKTFSFRRMWRFDEDFQFQKNVAVLQAFA